MLNSYIGDSFGSRTVLWDKEGDHVGVQMFHAIVLVDNGDSTCEWGISSKVGYDDLTVRKMLS